MIGALIKLQRGIKGGWQNHTETLRFVSREHLLLGRRHFIQLEADRRGYTYTARPDAPDAWWTSFQATLHGDQAWAQWTITAGWPWGPVSGDGTPANHSGADPYGPWHRDGTTYGHYRLESKYADGVLTL